MTALDVATIKRDFPILEREVNGKRLVYLDSASSSQKPLAVLDAMDDCYRNHYANIHRGVYTIAEEATAAFEDARAQGRAASSTRRTPKRSSSPATRPSRSTSSRTRGPGRTCTPATSIVLSHMEHHANVVPWQILAAERGIELRWIPLTADFRLDLTNLDALLDGAKLLAITRDVERARHDQRHPPARRRRPRARRARAGRRVPVRPARRDRRAGLGRRLRRLLVAQDARAHRDRRAVGPASSCSRRCPRSSAAAR